MRSNPFMSGLIQGLSEGLRVFIAPLRPVFWRTLATRGLAAALATANRRIPRTRRSRGTPR